MPLVDIHGGARIEVPNLAEVEAIVGAKVGPEARREWWHEQAAAVESIERERHRGWKVMDLPITLTGKVASSAITLGPANGQICGPEMGYAWSVMALIVTGLTTGGTPDVVNIYKNDTSRQAWWQLNGNSFGVTFGKLQRVMYSGEYLALQNSGSLAATGVITLTGTVIQVPAEELARLA